MTYFSCYRIDMIEQSKRLRIVSPNESDGNEVSVPNDSVTELLGSIALVYCGNKCTERMRLRLLGMVCPYSIIDAVRQHAIDLTDPDTALLVNQAQQTWLGCREGVLVGKEPIVILNLGEQ